MPIKSFFSISIVTIATILCLSPSQSQGSPRPYLKPSGNSRSVVPNQASSISPVGIAIAALRSGIPAGTPVGGHYDGLLSIKQRDYYAGGIMDSQTEARLKGLLEKELASAGYNNLQANSNSIFQAQLENV